MTTCTSAAGKLQQGKKNYSLFVCALLTLLQHTKLYFITFYRHCRPIVLLFCEAEGYTYIPVFVLYVYQKMYGDNSNSSPIIPFSPSPLIFKLYKHTFYQIKFNIFFCSCHPTIPFCVSQLRLSLVKSCHFFYCCCENI